MITEDRIMGFNTSKRLPIVFCLDVSPSMGWRIGNNSSSIELLNAAVSNFISELKQDPKARSAAEIAFVTFSTNIELDTEFESVNTIRTPFFAPVEHGGTQMAMAVLRAIQKIEDRRAQLENSEIGYYAPFLVIVTDGNPDKNDDLARYNQALSLIRSHCDSHIGASEIIVPFIIGVGDHIDPETLNTYAKGFTKGYFSIRGSASSAQVQFNKVFQMIGNSTKKSIHLNGSSSEVIHTIQNDMNDLLRDLAGE
ncbi:MAG: VWA domain-containing protein [Eubacterium sp.]|nr:VWA domain-containing protein [Eubacterium sp.]